MILLEEKPPQLFSCQRLWRFLIISQTKKRLKKAMGRTIHGPKKRTCRVQKKKAHIALTYVAGRPEEPRLVDEHREDVEFIVVFQREEYLRRAGTPGLRRFPAQTLNKMQF